MTQTRRWRLSEPESAITTIPSVFEALGISALEERLYVALIEGPHSSTRELAGLIGASRAQVQRGLALLRDKGLVTEKATRPPSYSPTPPQAAIEVLALKRQEEIHQARLAASDLAERLRIAAERSPTGDLLEVITGTKTIAQRFRQFQEAAREEVVGIDRPPYTPAHPTDEFTAEHNMLKRGVRVRAIYAKEALEYPGKLSVIRDLVSVGEEARVLQDVPTKLIIIDRSLAIMPLNFETPRPEDAVVVHASFLLHALILLFEALWEKATPLGPSSEDTPAEAAARDELLRLLASGLKDESIARILGWSRSTVTRRMRDLMEELGAKTRFQAALLAERRYSFYED